ncbi:MAG: hypothetical protein M3132_12625 [Actinomycetia bacterium]|nr:hypothetical protein [Actinomycetes bacterium]
MNELNIEQQTVTATDLEQSGAATTSELPTAPAGDSSGYIAELEKLA